MPGKSRPAAEDGPRSAHGAAAVIVLQAAFLAVLSIVLGVSGLRPGAFDRVGAEILAVLGLLSAVAVVVLARGVRDARPWARSPVVVLELISLPVAVTAVQGGRAYAGIPLAVSALAVLGLLTAAGQLTRPK